MRRAIGITRVSAEGDRETVHSYATQAARIERDCEQAGVNLLYVGQERNVSGGSNLTNRPELSRAVAAVEAGEADVIVAAYFDRFFRSLEVQGEVIKRIEAAGGEVLTLDHGMLTNATPAKRLQANIVGAMAQYFREETGRKVKDGHGAAVAAGKLPYPKIPLGYRKGADGRLTPDSKAPVVVELFKRRVGGESIHGLGRWLTKRGIRKSTTGVRTILKSRVYLGEIKFGELVNRAAHEPIVSTALWDDAQHGTGKPGRPALGEPRLLARLGVLRCQCGALMALGSSKQTLPKAGLRTYYFYRCGANPKCDRRMTIQAAIVEPYIAGVVRAALRDAQGRASMAESAREAARALETAQGDVDAILRILSATGAENEPTAIERLTEAIRVRDEAQVRLDQIGPAAARTVSADLDWDDLSLEGRRELIRATVESAVVAPGGRGAERITVNLRG